MDFPEIWFNNSDVSEPQSPVDWIRWGAHHEDDPWRFVDHFYTVTANRVPGQASGLTDASETLGLLPLPVANSYAWAALPGILKPDIGYASQLNTKNWPSTRTYQFLALTEGDSEDREANLAHMLFALGHIIHLNQDLSQPEHVRNDEHPFRRAIEAFGEEYYLKQENAFPLVPTEQRGWNWWRGQGFKSLLDFWDRGKFSGGSSAGLDADALEVAGQKLGLAEFSNGNFIGQDASYAEYFTSNHKHYFPFPSIKDTDQTQLKLGRLVGTLDTTTLRNGKQGQRSYLKKSGSGVTVTHHSAVKYLAVRNSPKMGGLSMRASLTINDADVLQDYHDILIPKAIEYSAGILDYFFRGKLEVAMDCGITIKNESGESLKGGEFRLYWEDASGIRTRIENSGSDTAGRFILEWDSNSSLADSGTISAIFQPPTSATVKKYILVYRGVIGIDGSGNALDPVEVDPNTGQGIAIAVKVFEPINLDCEGGTADAPDYYHESIPTQPERIYFKELAAIEALLRNSNYDDAESGDPCLSEGIPLYDAGVSSLRRVRYAGINGNYFNVAGKRVWVSAYMYFDDPLSDDYNPTWWFNMTCYQGENWASVLAGYKSTGGEIVGSFVDYSNEPGWSPALYTGPMNICKEQED